MTSVFSLPANKFYGHYQPRVDLAPVSEHHLRQFESLKNHTFQTGEEIREPLSILPELFPAFKVPFDRIRAGRIVLKISDTEEFDINHFPSNRTFLFLPNSVPFVDYFNKFVSALGVFTPLDSEDGASHNLGWQFAVGQSLLYQVALEMHLRGIEFERLSEGRGILSARDLALFSIFRERGLSGLAEEYSRHLPLNPEQIKTVPEAPPPFKLEQTALDAWAERTLSFDETLYRNNFSTIPATPGDRRYVDKLLSTHPVTDKSLFTLLDLIMKMAPMLASVLLDGIENAKIIWDVLRPPTENDADADWFPGASILDAHHLLGLSDSHHYKFVATKGQVAGDVLRDLVMVLSMSVMPKHFLDPWPRGSLKTIDERHRAMLHMQRNYVRQIMWGYTGLFEFVREAKLRRFQIELADSNKQRESLLIDRGFLVLCEQWERFEDPEDIQALRGELGSLADEFASKKLREAIKPSSSN